MMRVKMKKRIRDMSRERIYPRVKSVKHPTLEQHKLLKEQTSGQVRIQI